MKLHLQKSLLRFILCLSFTLFLFQHANSQQRVKKAVFQAFWWDYWNNNFPYGWANYLCELAPRLKAAGFDAVWIPPTYKGGSNGYVGYSPFDQYDLGDKFQKGGPAGQSNKTRSGTKDELLRMIAVMHANGLEVIQDVVLNHSNDAGSNTGAGGQDGNILSMANANGYKNFRYVSYASPAINESVGDYWTRSGRWSKNYPNFYPNSNYVCCTSDINQPYFGPDIAYEFNSVGQSSNIPKSGNTTIGTVTRPNYNPPQNDNYMRDNARNWIVWFKKQTGSDGWRWDAVKHFGTDVQQDLIYNTKYSAGFANGGQDMFNVGEWIGDAGVMDAYVNNVKTGVAPGGVTNEKHTGTFDFAFRGYNNGGIYQMVVSQGNFNMASLPLNQQGERYMDYPGGKRVYRSVPFVNSHDTYRPRLDNNGNYLKPLGDNSGWDTGNELGGNGQHIDPREPRFFAAYAAVCAVDGNPSFFFEDVFDVASTGKRWTHLPTSTVDLPIKAEMVNILHALQKLGFKDGDYAVPTAINSPVYLQGNSGDHLVIERTGKALIGLTDSYNQDQQVDIYQSSFAPGTVLYDYSGAHGTNTVTVQAGNRVTISTAMISHTIAGAYGHGYSIWAPAPAGVTISSVNDLYNYIASYAPARNTETTQEWEMANDLGDSHCSSLGQGGSLPANATNQRVAGKIYVEEGRTITYKAFGEINGSNVTATVWDLKGNILNEVIGAATQASPITGSFVATYSGWMIVKIRQSNITQAAQKAWVNVAYTAPAVVNTRISENAVANQIAVWTGNKGNTDPLDCGNWEEGKMPNANTNVLIPAYASPSPIIASAMSFKNITVEPGAHLTVNPGVKITVTGNYIGK